MKSELADAQSPTGSEELTIICLSCLQYWTLTLKSNPAPKRAIKKHLGNNAHHWGRRCVLVSTQKTAFQSWLLLTSWSGSRDIWCLYKVIRHRFTQKPTLSKMSCIKKQILIQWLWVEFSYMGHKNILQKAKDSVENTNPNATMELKSMHIYKYIYTHIFFVSKTKGQNMLVYICCNLYVNHVRYQISK